VAVIDAFDAMTTDRPYRQAMERAEAIEILRDGAGHQWDPKVVNVLLETAEIVGHDHDDGFHQRNGLFVPDHLSETADQR